MSTTVAGKVMPIIAVGSVDATRDFYVNTLGFTHMMGVVGKDGGLDFCSVLLGEAQVMFTRNRPAAVSAAAAGAAAVQPQAVEIYLEVEDVDAMHARLQKKGVPIVDPLTLQWWGDRTFKVKDPNGYVVWFYTNVAEPKPPQGMKVV
jgi:PhnB protein